MCQVPTGAAPADGFQGRARAGGAKTLGRDSAGSKGGRGSLETGDLASPDQAVPGVVGACDGHGRRPPQTGRSTDAPRMGTRMALAIVVTRRA